MLTLVQWLLFALFATGFIAAWAVYTVAPTRWSNRLLASFLFVDAGLLAGATLSMGFRDKPDVSGFFNLVLTLLFTLHGPLFLMALGRILDHGSVRWLRHRITSVVLGLYLVVMLALHGIFQDGGWSTAPDLLNAVLLMLLIGVTLAAAVLSLVGGALQFRSSRAGSVARTRARSFLIAFASRDVAVAMFLSVVLVFNMLLDSSVGADPEMMVFPVFVVAQVLFLAGILHATLRSGFLPVDERLRFTVKHSTIGAFFIAAFFLASEAAASLLSEAWGTGLGLGAAALLVFMIAPLQQVGDRVARKVVPEGRPWSEMERDERMALFEEECRIAWMDGRMGVKERKMLDSIRDRLDLSHDDAARVEARVLDAA